MLGLFAIFNVLLYFSNAHLFFFDARLTSFKPLYWYLITIVFGGIFLILHQNVRYPPSHYWRLIIWAMLFTMMASASFVLNSQADDNALQAFIKSSEAMAILIISLLFFRDEHIARSATFAVLVVAIFSVVMNYADFLHLLGNKIQFSFVTGRAAGLYENPNISGQQLVLGMVLSVFLVPRKLRWWYCLFIATGVILTFSRGAILLWIVAVFGLAWGNVFSLPRKISVMAIGTSAVLLSVTLVAGDWVNVFKTVELDRYLNTNTSSRIGQSFFDQNDFSSRTRLFVAEKGFSMLLEKPLFGWGIGSTQNPVTAIAPHNMYLLLGIEYGIPGVLMFCGLIWILWREGNERSGIIAVLYAIGGLFSHNNLDQPTVILVLALTLSTIGQPSIKAKSPECAL